MSTAFSRRRWLASAATLALSPRAFAQAAPAARGEGRLVVVFLRGAVDGLSLAILPGRTLALVGESGCGKTTVGKALLQLIPPTEGSVLLDGHDVRGVNLASLRGWLY